MRSIRDSICASEICGVAPPLLDIFIGPPPDEMLDEMLDSLLLNRGDERWLLLDIIAVSATAAAVVRA